MVWVVRVKQSDKYIDIQQRQNGLKPRRFPDSFDYFVGDYVFAGRVGFEGSVRRAIAPRFILGLRSLEFLGRAFHRDYLRP